MKIFRLKMQAYHYLEKYHFVCINETGDFMTPHNSRVRYHITLDKKEEVWIYYRYSKTKDSIGDYILFKEASKCRVRAAFNQVSKYNP